MKKAEKELQQLKGIGEILAKRFVEAGLDSFTRIVEAGEEGLKKIRGINPRAVPSILAQAAQLEGGVPSGRAERVAEVRKGIAELRGKVQNLAESARERFRDELAGRRGKKLAGELVQIIDALEQIEGKAQKQVKRTGKGLAKAQKRIEGLTEAGLKKVRKGLKRTKKALQRVLA